MDKYKVILVDDEEEGIDEEIIIKVQIFSAVFDIITLLEKTGEPGGI